jgi:succinate dehydrogenase/fumarate reductase flavoprotein subunit
MQETNGKKIKCDLLILGSEGAGARAAIEIGKCGLKPFIVTKGRIAKSGATVTAGMDMAIPSQASKEICGFEGDPNDTPETFMEDMVKAGKFMNNQELCWIHVNDAAKRAKELVDWGVKFDFLKQTPGHKYPRSLMSSGRRLVAGLKQQVEKYNIFEDTIITDLLTKDGRVTGAVGINIRNGEFLIIQAKAVIIATGGAMRIWPRTTAPEELTGDGFGMAYRAGAELVDMEFPMFLPACCVWPPALVGTDVPYLFSANVGGWWINKRGVRFMKKWDPEHMEFATRDVSSIAQYMEVLDGNGSPHGGIFVSFAHLPQQVIDYFMEWQSTLKNFKYGSLNLKKFGFDEAGPAAHYWNGGIKINVKSQTNIPGLFAAGEVAGGNMGANRISGNAITECIVWGARAGKYAAEYVANSFDIEPDNDQINFLKEKIYGLFKRGEGEKISPFKIKQMIQRIANDYVGPVRDGQGLEKALKEIEKIRVEVLPRMGVTTEDRYFNREWVEGLQVENMLQTLELVARTSLTRTESRGALYRKDFPNTDNKNWLKNIVIREKDGKQELRLSPIVVTKISPPKPDIVPYWVPE